MIDAGTRDFHRRYPLALERGDPRAEDDALRHDCAIVEAPWESILRVQGEDAADFLQALLTQEITGLPDGRTVPAALADRKGHWHADLRVHRAGDRFLLRLRADRVPAVREIFERHRFGERVLWSRVNGRGPLLVLGPSARRAFNHLGGEPPAPEQEGGSLPAPFRGVWMQVRETSDCDLLIVPAEDESPHPLASLLDGSRPIRQIGARAFHRGRIEAGTPWFGLDGGEERLVPEVVPEDRIHRQKGCYLGQETIARLQWRGRLRRRLARVRLAAGALPDPGTPLLSPTGEPGGHLLSSAQGWDGAILAFALRVLAPSSDDSQSSGGRAEDVTGRPASPDEASAVHLTDGRIGSWVLEPDRTPPPRREPA